MVNTINVKANMVIVNAKNAAMMIVTAESCTGGLVSGALTEIAGASDVFERGFVTYSNASKVEALGVPAEVIAAYGAVSAETARAMALGALERSAADISVSITGIAGPGGGSVEKPVGLVHFASARRGGAVVHIERRFGPLSRADIRAAAVDQALDMLLAAIGD